jgi:hypothetical protein
VWQGSVEVAVSLLDPVKGHPIQTWEFNGRSVIRIGRDEANDVTLADPLVSRLHAELVSDASGCWRVVSVGRNGTFVDGEPVSEPVPIRHGTTLQLGSNGPWLEFSDGRREDRGGETILAWGASDFAMPQLDEELVKTEVTKIAEGETFKDLQRQARDLKRARDTDDFKG